MSTPNERLVTAQWILERNLGWVQLSHLVNPGVPRSVSCAKYAAAFLRNTSLGRLQ